jgi:hypothetical protein
MLLRSCANPVIIRDVQFAPGQPESFVLPVNPFYRRDPMLVGGTYHVLAVLVHAHAEKGLVSLQAVIARHHIGSHLL